MGPPLTSFWLLTFHGLTQTHPLAYFKNNHCVERGQIDRKPGCPSAKTEVKVLGFVNRVAVVRIVYEVELIN